MNKIRLINLSRLSIINLQIAFFAGLNGVIIANRLGPAIRGQIGLMIAIYGLIVIFIDRGNLNAATHFAAQQNTSVKYLHSLIHEKLVQNSRQIITILLIAGFFARSNFSIILIFCIATAAIINNFFAGPIHILQAIDFKAWKSVLWIQIPLYICSILFFYFVHVNIYLAFFSMTLIPLSSSLLAARKMNHTIKLNSLHQPFLITENLSKYANSNLFSLITLEIYRRIDFLLVILFLGNFSGGIYMVALSWLLLLSPIPDSLGNIVFLEFSASYKTITSSKYKKIFREFFTKALVINVINLLALTGSGLLLIPRIYNSQYTEVLKLILLMMPLALSKSLTNLLIEIAKGINFHRFTAINLLLSSILTLIVVSVFKIRSLQDIIVVLDFQYFLSLLWIGSVLYFKNKTNSA